MRPPFGRLIVTSIHSLIGRATQPTPSSSVTDCFAASCGLEPVVQPATATFIALDPASAAPALDPFMASTDFEPILQRLLPSSTLNTGAQDTSVSTQAVKSLVPPSAALIGRKLSFIPLPMALQAVLLDAVIVIMSIAPVLVQFMRLIADELPEPSDTPPPW